HPARLESLQPEVAERDLLAACGQSAATTALLLSELHLLRHQHDAISPEPLRLLLRTAARARLGHLALEDPDLDADRAVGRVGRGHAVVDVGLERVQRQAAVLIPLAARDLGAVQTAADTNLDSLRAEAKGRFHCLLHRPAERDAALELGGDVLGHELRVELRTLDLLDVDVDLTVDELLQLVAELVDFSALASDDDSRARRIDVDAHLVRRALDVDLRDSGVRKTLLQILAELQIAMQRLGV